jgi:hypothetical protein
VDASRIKVHGDDGFAEIASKFCDGLMARVGRVHVECRAITERDDQPGVVRARRADEILADLQIQDAVDVGQGRQPDR